MEWFRCVVCTKEERATIRHFNHHVHGQYKWNGRATKKINRKSRSHNTIYGSIYHGKIFFELISQGDFPQIKEEKNVLVKIWQTEKVSGKIQKIEQSTGLFKPNMIPERKRNSYEWLG